MSAAPSDAPQRAPGLRTRSGNAMLRTRTAILDAAAACVGSRGVRRTTMADVAATGGVAKATLYNHFRTKDDVLAALVDARVAALGDACVAAAASRGLAVALDLAATELADLAALRRVAAEEPALLAPLAVPGEGRGWDAVRAAVGRVLVAGGAASGPAQVELVLRWLLSQLLWPVEDRSTSAQLVAAGVGAGASTAAPQGRPAGTAQDVGLGWPGGPATLRTS